jgi:hypothetical protein
MRSLSQDIPQHFQDLIVRLTPVDGCTNAQISLIPSTQGNAAQVEALACLGRGQRNSTVQVRTF